MLVYIVSTPAAAETVDGCALETSPEAPKVLLAAGEVGSIQAKLENRVVTVLACLRSNLRKG